LPPLTIKFGVTAIYTDVTTWSLVLKYAVAA